MPVAVFAAGIYFVYGALINFPQSVVHFVPQIAKCKPTTNVAQLLSRVICKPGYLQPLFKQASNLARIAFVTYKIHIINILYPNGDEKNGRLMPAIFYLKSSSSIGYAEGGVVVGVGLEGVGGVVGLGLVG